MGVLGVIFLFFILGIMFSIASVIFAKERKVKIVLIGIGLFISLLAILPLVLLFYMGWVMREF